MMGSHERRVPGVGRIAEWVSDHLGSVFFFFFFMRVGDGPPPLDTGNSRHLRCRYLFGRQGRSSRRDDVSATHAILESWHGGEEGSEKHGCLNAPW
jgi:hypothetical protein